MSEAGKDRPIQLGSGESGQTRAELMERHAQARARRDASPLGSDAFRAAAEEVARIEIAIAALEEPPPDKPAA